LSPYHIAQEITSIGIECAVCSSVDLCIECFAVGAELPELGHTAAHDYRVHENLSSFALYDREWTAEDELLLLQGIDMYGMGNWRCVPAARGGMLRDGGDTTTHRGTGDEAEDEPHPTTPSAAPPLSAGTSRRW
jgi:hypothetical protein